MTEKQQQFLDALNDMCSQTDLERNNYPDSEELGETEDDDFEAAIHEAAEIAGITIDEAQEALEIQ